MMQFDQVADRHRQPAILLFKSSGQTGENAEGMYKRVRVLPRIEKGGRWKETGPKYTKKKRFDHYRTVSVVSRIELSGSK